MTAEGGSAITNTHYLDGFQYTDDHLDFFPHAEGYVNVLDYEQINYVYTYKDHLGNIRLRYALDPGAGGLAILEEDHYYPFGLKHKGYNGEHEVFERDPQIGVVLVPVNPFLEDRFKYKLNSREYQDELGLNMYDMDLRMYDPAIARWVVQDPVVHFDYSPYTAFDNNPVFWADPSGADAESFLIDLFERSESGENWTNSGNGSFTSSTGQTAECDDCKDEESTVQEESCCGDTIRGVGKGLANGVVDMFGFGWETGLNNIIGRLSGNEDFVLLPRFDVNQGEEAGYMAGIILFAIADPSPVGEIHFIKIVIQGGKATKIIKGVNTMLPHAVERGVERGIFRNADEASATLKQLTKNVGSNKLPQGAIVDPSKTDRILVPVGNNGMAVYQVGSNGTAKLKTVLNAN